MNSCWNRDHKLNRETRLDLPITESESKQKLYSAIFNRRLIQRGYHENINTGVINYSIVLSAYRRYRPTESLSHCAKVGEN